MKTKLVETPSAMPNTPSVVSHRCDIALVQGRALVGQHVGRIGAEEDVGEEHQRDDHQRRPERAPGRLEQQDHADHRDHEVERGRPPRPARELVVEQLEVGRGERRRAAPAPSPGAGRGRAART